MPSESRTGPQVESPLKLLSEVADPAAYSLPHRLARVYSGTLGFESPSVYANFVSSVDGVVALGHEHASSGAIISGGAPADRFVMGLLRACADAVLVGAGTLRGSPGHRWTPEYVYPAAAADFAELRRRLGRAKIPRLVVVTASGVLNGEHPGLLSGTLVLTSDAGAQQLRGRLPGGVVVRSLGGGDRLSVEQVVDAVLSEGHRVVLTEGGPTMIGQLVAAGLLDELFLTLSPVLFGRAPANQRQGVVDAAAFAAEVAPRLDLRSVRQHGSYLFLRYALTKQEAQVS